MKIVIDIPEEEYNNIEPFLNGETIKGGFNLFKVLEIIKKGTPLPKGHGRLIDADSTLATAWTNFYKHEDEWEKKDNNYLPFGRMYDQNGFECCQQTIVNAPTIIEAEGSDSE